MEKNSRKNKNSWVWGKQAWVMRYGLAVVLVMAGLGLRLALTAWVGPGLPTYITFYPAVMVAALLGGFGPGFLATVLTNLAVEFLILPQGRQLAAALLVDRVGQVLFISMGLFMGTVAELYRRNRDKAVAYDKESVLRETLRQKEFLAGLLENAEQPFAVGYPDGHIGLFNRAYEELTGYTAAELRAINWVTVLTPPEWRELETQNLDKLNRTGQPVRYEKEYIRKDGSRVPIELLVHLKRDAEDKPEYFYSFLIDISERKQAEAALRQNQRDLNRAQEVGQIGSWRLDTGRNILTWSDENHRIFGVPAETSMTYETFLGAVHPDDRQYVDSRWKAALTGEPYDIEHRIVAGGQVKWVREKAYLEFDEAGKLLGGFGITQDITIRKQAEEILKRDKEAFERLVQERTRELVEMQMELERAKRLSDIGVLATSVAHELRNPLAAIGIEAHNIRRVAINPDIDKPLGNIDKMLVESNQIIDNLLSYSRIRPPYYERVNMIDILEESIGFIEDKRIKNISIIKNLDSLKSVSVEADPLQIKEVLHNLLNNACDAVSSKKGKVKITAENEDRFIKVAIEDNGAGMDQDTLDKAFNPFFTTKAKGTGLGLSICRQIVDLHGGSVSIESEVGQGTAVIVRLPKGRNRVTRDKRKNT